MNKNQEETVRQNEEGERMVWSIMDNAWVTISYWRWVNGKSE